MPCGPATVSMNGKAADQIDMPQTITPVLSKACQALDPNEVAVVEHARHKHNIFFGFPFTHLVGLYVQNSSNLTELSCTY